MKMGFGPFGKYPARARLAGIVAMLLVLGACATPGPETGATPATNAASSQTLAVNDETLLMGFGAISGKYIGRITPGALATEGLRGLATIDPALTVRADGDTIELRRHDDLIASRTPPHPDALAAWTELTATMVNATRAASPDMASATPERIYEALFDAALSNLDVFSRYAGAEQARKNRAKRDGYGGVGLHFNKDADGLLVTRVLVGTPAATAGLMVDDIITAIDGSPTADMTLRDAGHRLRGPVLSKVALSVERVGVPASRDLILTRAHIVPETVSARLEAGFLYLKIKSFNRKTADALTGELKNAEGQAKGVILDLRGNPGGLLSQSIDVADLFLSEGRIMSTAGRHADSVQIYRANGQDAAPGLPMAVIVDGKSASAAEVVAAALQDQGRAVVIGATSFGKGTVQTVIRLPNDGEITLTWSRLIAPSGYAFHELGVPPAICTSRGSAAPKTDSATLIAKALRPGGPTLDTLQSWRQLGHTEPVTAGETRASRRQALRARCPSERLYTADMPTPGQRDREIQVAEALLGDATLYARARQLSLPPTDTAAAP